MSNESSKLVVVWTSADPEVAREMVFMYTLNAKLRGWWEDITLVIWGPSERLISTDQDLQARLKKIVRQGIKVEACLACSDDYAVTEALKNLDVDVKYMGVPLTDYIKSGRHVITF